MVGSGAAGMVAALTAAHQGLSTVVVEKAPHYGGSTARSGGGVWIPNNEILKRDGVTDTPEAARTVPAHDHRRRRRTRAHRHLPRPRPRDAVVRVEELAAEAVLGARLLRLLPGEPRAASPTGRSVEPKPFNAKKLGADRARPRTAVRQGAAEHGGHAAGLRAAQPAQAAPAWPAAQPQGGRPLGVGAMPPARTWSAWAGR